MSGAADLLRAAGVARAFFRLVGRNRVASVVAFVVALGWFLYGLDAGAVAGSLGLIVAGPYGDFYSDPDPDPAGTDGDRHADDHRDSGTATRDLDALGWN